MGRGGGGGLCVPFISIGLCLMAADGSPMAATPSRGGVGVGSPPLMWGEGGVLGVPTPLYGRGGGLGGADPLIWGGGDLVGVPTPLYEFGGGVLVMPIPFCEWEGGSLGDPQYPLI